jgi:hypothetical protein
MAFHDPQGVEVFGASVHQIPLFIIPRTIDVMGAGGEESEVVVLGGNVIS